LNRKGVKDAEEQGVGASLAGTPEAWEQIIFLCAFVVQTIPRPFLIAQIFAEK